MRAKAHLHTPLTRALVEGAVGCGRIMGACWQCRHRKRALAQTLEAVSELSLAQPPSGTWRQ